MQQNNIFIGGSPSFEMVDDKRIAMNHEALIVLQGNGDNRDKVDYLCSLGGRIFNLNNSIPEDVGTSIKQALSQLALAIRQEIEQEPNRSLAQTVLDAMGPEKDAGFKCCDGFANGWIYSNALTE